MRKEIKSFLCSYLFVLSIMIFIFYWLFEFRGGFVFNVIAILIISITAFYGCFKGSAEFNRDKFWAFRDDSKDNLKDEFK